MEKQVNDILVSREVLKLFKTSVRIIDKKHLAGIFPIDPGLLIRLKKTIPEMFNDSILKKYNVAVGYQGKTIQSDFAKLGIQEKEIRIENNIWICGIPVPWQMLRKADIDYKKFNVYLTPKR
jgi:hypothetical protein